MFIYNQIIICQEIIVSQPSVLCTNGSVSKNRLSACVIVQVRYNEKKHFVTHNYCIYSIFMRCFS